MGWIVSTKIIGITVVDNTEKIRFPLPSQYCKKSTGTLCHWKELIL